LRCRFRNKSKSLKIAKREALEGIWGVSGVLRGSSCWQRAGWLRAWLLLAGWLAGWLESRIQSRAEVEGEAWVWGPYETLNIGTTGYNIEDPGYSIQDIIEDTGVNRFTQPGGTL